MPNINDMAEQHILEFESRQKHMEELLARARELTGSDAGREDVRSEIERLATEHDRLSGVLDRLKQKAPKDWQKEEIAYSGPMAVWDIIAQNLEELVEKLAGPGERQS